MLRLYNIPKDSEGQGADLITEASNLLEVGEFQLFQLGYAAWFGHDAQEKQLEPAFFDYLLSNEVPFYARHYARHIIALEKDQNLTPYDPDYHRFDNPGVRPETRLSGFAQFTLIILSTIILFVVMSIAAISIVPKGVQCWFPPCYWDENDAPPPK